MKNIYKLVLIAIISLSIISCENDNSPVVSSNGFELRADQTIVAPTILTTSISSDVFAKYDWDITDNGPSSVSKYELLIFDRDNDPNKENPVVYSGSGINITPDVRNATLTVQEFNALVNLLPSMRCSQMNIDVVVKATLGVNPADNFVQYSNPISYSITPYATKQLVLAFTKDGSNASEAQQIKSSSFQNTNDYEGYLFLEAGNYKFHQPDPCGDFASSTIYGGSANTLDSSSSAASIVVPETGHYYVTANLDANTYNVRKFRAFGVYGNGTRTGFGFNNSVPMNYDTTTKTWKLTIELIKGKDFKFKSNDWTGNLVTATPPNMDYVPGSATSFISILGKLSEGVVVLDNPNTSFIRVPGTFDNNARQKYDVELDVSRPRDYTYKLTINNN